jgi:Ca-activated chloride channel family protein
MDPAIAGRGSTMIDGWLTGLAMIDFDWPWVFAALPLPLLIRLLLPAAPVVQEAALRVPTLQPFALEQPRGVTSSTGKGRGLWWLALLAWLCLLTAAARPVWHGEPIELPVSGRDLMLAVDLSGSMDTQDFVIRGQRVNRLQATQIIASDFIKRRVGDRIGLILFGRRAYVQTPLTFDRKTVGTLLREAAIGLAGKETAIGDAIGLAVKRLKADPDDSKVLILLTDGANTAGEVEPRKAAELAAQEGLKIYTIGVGADEMLVDSLFGTRRINPSADLDEKTLKAIAETTGGKYFRARDSGELEKIYQLLDELEPVKQDVQTFRPQRSLLYVPLAIAVMLAGLIVIVRVSRP